MEKFFAAASLDQTELELPPGFRFHPTDEELITHYLYPKVMDTNFSTIAIGEVDLNKVEPWELPRRAKMGEKEWYFYSKRDRKYPTGTRTNRASKDGYWKTTGKDKDVFKKRRLFGMKKTLVFYKGRAPNGEKTNWVMHEYRLVVGGNLFESIQTCSADQNEWVICRIFKKSSGSKKIDISSMKRNDNKKDDISVASSLPTTLVDLSSDDENPKQITAVDSPNVSASFSGFLMEDKNYPLDHNNLIIPDFPNNSSSMPAYGFSNNLAVSSQSVPSSYIEDLRYADLSFVQEQQSVHGLLLLDAQVNGGQNASMGFSWENNYMYNNYPPLHSNNNHTNVDFNCMWN